METCGRCEDVQATELIAEHVLKWKQAQLWAVSLEGIQRVSER